MVVVERKVYVEEKVKWEEKAFLFTALEAFQGRKNRHRKSQLTAAPLKSQDR